MELREAVVRHGVGADAAGPLARLLAALRQEPDPHTTVAAEDAVDVHVADSLVALEVEGLRRAARIADLGAGAGFPGLPLAVALPDAQVDLIESSRRKCAVIERLAAAAGVGNARVVCARAEDWAAGEGRDAYGAVCVRAVAQLPVLVEYAAPLLADRGLLVAWKGSRDPGEEARGEHAARIVGLEPLGERAVEPYPGSLNRHLHLYRKLSPTPARFPRRAGIAVKRPLA
jgi:16S rRNA (guanine527-N7)-methyltransferase